MKTSLEILGNASFNFVGASLSFKQLVKSIKSTEEKGMRQGVENERYKKISLPFPCKEAVQDQLCSGFSRLVSSSEEFQGICAVH